MEILRRGSWTCRASKDGNSAVRDLANICRADRPAGRASECPDDGSEQWIHCNNIQAAELTAGRLKTKAMILTDAPNTRRLLYGKILSTNCAVSIPHVVAAGKMNRCHITEGDFIETTVGEYSYKKNNANETIRRPRYML